MVLKEENKIKGENMKIKVTAYLPNNPTPIHTVYFKNVDNAVSKERLLNRRGFQTFIEYV